MANRQRSFRRGDTVRIVKGNYPVRYMGRAATVAGTEVARGHKRFLLDFSPRRENPLSVAASHLNPASE